MVADIVQQVVVLFVSLIALLITSKWVIDSSVKISHLSGMSELITGFLLVSVATSIPEFSVSLSALLLGDVGISVGNLLGSNVADIALIIGISALMRPIIIRRREWKSLTTVLFISSLVLIFLLSVTFASRIIGLILIAIFALFVYFSFKKKAKLKVERNHGIPSGKKPAGLWARALFWFMIGMGGVLLSSAFLVDSAASIAQSIGITQAVIGATVIAVGTSLPELAISIQALKRGHMNLALGNAIGSTLTNITLILGFVLLTSSFVVNLAIFETILIFVLLTNIMLWFFIDRGRLSRKEGLILIFVYQIFLVTVFGVQIAII